MSVRSCLGEALGVEYKAMNNQNYEPETNCLKTKTGRVWEKKILIPDRLRSASIRCQIMSQNENRHTGKKGFEILLDNLFCA